MIDPSDIRAAPGGLGAGVTADVGLLYYVYPNGNVGDANVFEPYASVTGAIGPVTAKVGVAYAWKQDSLGGDDNLYIYNDLGLATANTLAAIRAGATHANTTVNGLGERAGNAALEEVVMGLKHVHGLNCGVRTSELVRISKLVERASGRPVGASKCIVGDAVFTHESGIHVDGLAKHPATYEGFDPAELGRQRQTVLGKHSGSRAVRLAYQALGLPVDEPQVPQLLERVRAHAVRTKRSPTSSELQQFYLEFSPMEGQPS